MLESEKRRPDFLGGVPVKMSDGQEWFIAKPRVRLTPDDTDGYRQVIQLVGDCNYQSLVQKRMEARQTLSDLQDSEPDNTEAINIAAGKALGCHFAMLKALFDRNYTLTRDELDSVLAFSLDDEDDPEGAEILEVLTAIAEGDAPKAKGGTSDSPQSPEA